MTVPDGLQSEGMPAKCPPRIVIEAIEPEIDGGRYPVKRVVGEDIVVSADIYIDGHDQIDVVLRYRNCGKTAAWSETPMVIGLNDRWTAHFATTEPGRYEYTIEAWVDRFGSWRRDLGKKFEARQELYSELLEGRHLIEEAATRASGPEAGWLRERAAIVGGDGESELRVRTALEEQLVPVMFRYADRSRAARCETVRSVIVDRQRAVYGAWYEMFPRSCGADDNQHGTFQDASARLPYIAYMGFDVVYLPPIHPIGSAFRKGPNNSLNARPNDPGSPWAIGSSEGGHTAVHPQLGTLADFDNFVAAAQQLNLEIALDFAIQCSPDHPWVVEHPEWFRHRPDGTIKYAENPPKKYQDIYPIDFECEAWQELWQALRDVVLFWIGHGVRIFRVDNPHTKAFPFWEWMIRDVQARYPDTIFLAEAFTRPKVMQHLAKTGFTQSYTYFTWKNAQHELIEYFTELTRIPVAEYMRPNVFANTPDILHAYLQNGGRGAFMSRLVLASMLSATYGIYGPAYELCEGHGVPGSEEYYDSEKYQIRRWELDRHGNIRDFITRVNNIRREHRALHINTNLEFFPVDNEQLIFFGKTMPDPAETILVVVNLDPHYAQSGFVSVPLQEMGIGPDQSYEVHDLLSDARYTWRGTRNFVLLNPQICPAHIFRVFRE